jgi:hypothetical protein
MLDEDQRQLGFYSPADFQVLKVRDELMPGYATMLIVDPNSSSSR